jgi:anti-anti-sigma factor
MLSELWPEESWRGRRAAEVEVSECAGERARITVAGDVDAASTAGLQKAVVEVLRRHRPRSVDLDLAGVTFLDSAGISGLLLCLADARQIDCEFALRNTPTTVYRLLQVAGLLEHFGLIRPAPRPACHGAGGAALGLLGSGRWPSPAHDDKGGFIDEPAG